MVENNPDCLREILEFNINQNILFFRISSDLVPFASHPICKFKWQEYFRKKFEKIGNFITRKGIRISMHPDQFTLINSPDRKVLENRRRELLYHAEVLGLMGLPTTAKIQLHVGGVFGDKEESIKRFIERYTYLPKRLKRRLVIENDDRKYNLRDCLRISHQTGIPILFDVFHHRINSSGEGLGQAFKIFTQTWPEKDGLPMVDYSSQEAGKRKGRHAETSDPTHFRRFLEETKWFDFDIMLEIKDKEKSAIRAVDIAGTDRHFVKLRRA